MPNEDSVSLKVAIDAEGADAALASVAQSIKALGSAVSAQSAGIAGLGDAMKAAAAASGTTAAALGTESSSRRAAVGAIEAQAEATKKLNAVQESVKTPRVVPLTGKANLLAEIPAELFGSSQKSTARKSPLSQKEQDYINDQRVKEAEEAAKAQAKEQAAAAKEQAKASAAAAKEQAKEQAKSTKAPSVMGDLTKVISNGGGLMPIVSAISGPAGIALGVIKTTFGAITSVVTSVASTIYSVMKTAFFGIGAVGVVALAGLGAGFFALKATADAVAKVFDDGAGVANLSQRTGVGVEALLKLERGFKAAGMSTEQVAPSLAHMSKSLEEASQGTGDVATTFTALGLNVKELKSMAPEQAFLKIGEAVNRLPTSVERSAIAMKVFSRAGGELLPLFGNLGAIAKVNEELSNSGKIMAQDALLFRLASERLETVKMPTMKEGIGQIATGIADKVAGEFLAITEGAKRIDLSGIGQAIGGEVALGMEAFRTGNFGEYITDSIKVVGPKIKAFFSDLFSGDGDLLKSPAMQFGIHLLDAVQDIGAEIGSQLDGPIEKLTGVSLSSMLTAITSFISSAISVFLTVGEIIANSTLQLVIWGEKLVGAFQKIISYLPKEKTKEQQASDTFYAAQAYGMGSVAFGGKGQQEAAATILAPKKDDFIGPPMPTADEAEANRKAAFANTIAGLKANANAATASVLGFVNEGAAKIKERSGKSDEEKAKDLADAEERRNRLLGGVTDNKAKYTAQAEANSKQGGGASIEKAIRSTQVVADSMQSMGGGGGFLITGNSVADNTAETAKNTAEIAKNVKNPPTVTATVAGASDTSPTLGKSPQIGSNAIDERQVSLLGDMKGILTSILNKMATGNTVIGVTAV
jgi:hypothetical protein